MPCAELGKDLVETEGQWGKARVQGGATLTLKCVSKAQANMSRRQLDTKIGSSLDSSGLDLQM